MVQHESSLLRNDLRTSGRTRWLPENALLLSEKHPPKKLNWPKILGIWNQIGWIWVPFEFQHSDSILCVAWVGNITQTLSHTCHCDGFRLSPYSGFIGRLDAQKGYDLLLESLVEVLEDLIEKKVTDGFVNFFFVGSCRHACIYKIK